MQAKFFNSSSSLFRKRFDFGGVRIVLYSLRALFMFDDETSEKFMMTLRVKGKLSFASYSGSQSKAASKACVSYFSGIVISLLIHFS